jgi:hypothetical protein
VQQFACLCVIDASSIETHELSAFCSRLIDLGCAYYCTWGPDCERVHDIMDQQVIGENPPATDIGCLMTTWHAQESLAEAVDFFLTWTVPDEEYAPERFRGTQMSADVLRCPILKLRFSAAVQSKLMQFRNLTICLAVVGNRLVSPGAKNGRISIGRQPLF